MNTSRTYQDTDSRLSGGMSLGKLRRRLLDAIMFAGAVLGAWLVWSGLQPAPAVVDNESPPPAVVVPDQRPVVRT